MPLLPDWRHQAQLSSCTYVGILWALAAVALQPVAVAELTFLYASDCLGSQLSRWKLRCNLSDQMKMSSSRWNEEVPELFLL